MSPERSVPPWLMGVSGASFGVFPGFLALTLPQALASQHVPETTIAMIFDGVIHTWFCGFFGKPNPGRALQPTLVRDGSHCRRSRADRRLRDEFT